MQLTLHWSQKTLGAIVCKWGASKGMFMSFFLVMTIDVRNLFQAEVMMDLSQNLATIKRVKGGRGSSKAWGKCIAMAKPFRGYVWELESLEHALVPRNMDRFALGMSACVQLPWSQLWQSRYNVNDVRNFEYLRSGDMFDLLNFYRSRFWWLLAIALKLIQNLGRQSKISKDQRRVALSQNVPQGTASDQWLPRKLLLQFCHSQFLFLYWAAVPFLLGFAYFDTQGLSS